MTKDQILFKIEKLDNRIELAYSGIAFLASAKELINAFIGKKNSFYESLDLLQKSFNDPFLWERVKAILHSFKEAVELDLVSVVSIQRQAQVEVVNDFLSQAEDLLNTKGIHPAAAAILVGASLEEFLRNWCEEEGKEIMSNDSIDSYSKFLRERDFLDKQDMKEILAWTGIRNNAAHGHWDKVADQERIGLMLGGVNLFIRIKTSSKMKP